MAAPKEHVIQTCEGLFSGELHGDRLLIMSYNPASNVRTYMSILNFPSDILRPNRTPNPHPIKNGIMIQVKINTLVEINSTFGSL